MKYIIGCDNATVRLKDIVKNYVKLSGFEVEDIGCFSSDDQIYYPLIAKKVCEKIIESDYTKRGILICGTGIGMCITANKFKGIRAAVCHDNYSGERSILSNDCQVLCLGERVVGSELAKKIVSEWINLSFKDGTSTPKIKCITEIDSNNFL